MAKRVGPYLYLRAAPPPPLVGTEVGPSGPTDAGVCILFNMFTVKLDLDSSVYSGIITLAKTLINIKLFTHCYAGYASGVLIPGWAQKGSKKVEIPKRSKSARGSIG